jgi:hypothetical protein
MHTAPVPRRPRPALPTRAATEAWIARQKPMATPVPLPDYQVHPNTVRLALWLLLAVLGLALLGWLLWPSGQTRPLAYAAPAPAASRAWQWANETN